jgi:hypothetical protein
MSVAIKSAYVISHSNAFIVIALAIARGFVVLAFQLLVVLLQLLALQSLALLASGVPLYPLSLVVPCRPGVGLRS